MSVRITGDGNPKGVKRTRKPCPGCGHSDALRSRPVSEVCGPCKALLRAGRLYAEQVDAGESGELCGVPESPHYLPYIAHAEHFGGGGKREVEAGRDIQRAMVELAVAISKPSPVGNYGTPPLIPKSDTCRNYRLFPVGVVPILRTLYAAIQQATDIAYRRGVDYGGSILRRLASGEVGANDFDDTLARQGNGAADRAAEGADDGDEA